jgi:hypothetical protein
MLLLNSWRRLEADNGFQEVEQALRPFLGSDVIIDLVLLRPTERSQPDARVGEQVQLTLEQVTLMPSPDRADMYQLVGRLVPHGVMGSFEFVYGGSIRINSAGTVSYEDADYQATIRRRA